MSLSVQGTTAEQTASLAVTGDMAILTSSVLYSASGKHTVTEKTLARVTIKGAGGGGAGARLDVTYGTSGSGGGEGEEVSFWIWLLPGVEYPFTIGAGGAAGAVTGDGGNGGTTTWNGTKTAAGGYGATCLSAICSNNTATKGKPGNGGGTGLQRGESGSQWTPGFNTMLSGGKGGGRQGGSGGSHTQAPQAGALGCGGGGGYPLAALGVGGKGGDGYVLIEWYTKTAIL